MTVQTLNSVAEFVTNGVTTNFPFFFKFLANEDLVVSYVSPLGTLTVLALGTDYTANGAGNDEGGSIVTTAALAGPGQLVVSREMDAYQQTSLRNQGKFLAETHEDVFDRLTMLIQQGDAIFTRALTRPLGRDYFFAEDRRIASVADPIDDQDAATKKSVQDYVSGILETGQGPINNAANVIYVYPDSVARTVQSLSNYIDPLLGSQGIGHYNPDGTEQSVGDVLNRAVETVDSVFALLSAPKKPNCEIAVISYHPGYAATANGAIGGGLFIWSPTTAKSSHNGGTIISPTVPWDGTQAGLQAFLTGTGETLPAGSGCWKRVSARVDVLMFGARGNNSDNDIYSFQKAMDTVKVFFVPNNVYSLTGTLNFNFDGVTLVGESMKLTVLNFTGTGKALQNPLSATTTRLFCGITNLQITQPNNAGTPVVDWKSMQFGQIRKVWILGKSVGGCTAIMLIATWITTECTYNLIEDCYFGNCATGVFLGDGANNNNIVRNRFQIGFAGGSGVTLSGTSPGRISSNNIAYNGFEYPGNISAGITVQQMCDGLWIYGNRFEQLSNGIVLGAVGNKNVNGINRVQNYFDSCTTNINISAGARTGAPAEVAAGSYSGSGGLTEVGSCYGMTGVRTAVGTYVFTYADATYPDASQVINLTSAMPINVISPLATGFSLITQNASGVNTDSPRLFLSVKYNR